ncbi:MAG: 3-dehydroquinate synthase [Anaerolineaceae bacterium]|nr:3-dehydroquinate synthase [Anaerolineaceae bacterium]
MQTVNVALGDRSYDILVGRGLLREAGRLVSHLFSPRRVLVVSDSRVADLYMKPLESSLVEAGFTVSTAVVPEGEQSKSGEQLFELYEACFAANLERRSLVVALGGGVVGDLAGYLAASYLRGLAFIQVPTTLLSQVDSSVGGKTGINLPNGKNLVGAFHQPSLVLADIETLSSLDRRQMATGLAEVVKHGMIRDAALLTRLEAEADKLVAGDLDVLEEVVARNCRIKAEVVASDELEAGLRAILNYGHTIGHAIESVASYGVYTHGEAVALGMNGEALIARGRGLIDEAVHSRQQGLLERIGLPGKLREPLGVDRLLEAMRHDKKVRAGRLRFVLPEAIGRVKIADDVTEAELREALDHLQP